MTRCPEHGGEGAHTAIVIRWDTWELEVEHRCGGSGDGDDRHTWTEPARDPDALLRRAGLCRIKGEQA